MWHAYPDLRNKKQLSELLANGMTRPEIAEYTGCSLSSVGTALRHHKLSSKRGARCKNCLSYHSEELGTGFCSRQERVVGGMAVCELFCKRTNSLENR